MDCARKPWSDGDILFSDPGHALEFIGLAGKCLLTMQKNGVQGELINDLQEILPKLFCHVFDYGFNHKSGGICKGFNLKSRKPVNSDMPWWNLPETVRAGLELMVLYPDHVLTDQFVSNLSRHLMHFSMDFSRKTDLDVKHVQKIDL